MCVCLKNLCAYVLLSKKLMYLCASVQKAYVFLSKKLCTSLLLSLGLSQFGYQFF